MKIYQEENERSFRIVLDISDNPTWVSYVSSQLFDHASLEQEGVKFSFDASEWNNDETLQSVISNILWKYEEDGNKYSFADSGDYLKTFKWEMEQNKSGRIRISESFKNVIEENFKKEEINRNYFKDTFVPYDFQTEHAKNIISKIDSANFSSPGAGKTIISYMAVGSLLADKKISDVVVFGPKSASLAWRNEWNIVLKDEAVDEMMLHRLNFSAKKFKDLKQLKPTQFSEDKLNIWFINYHKLNDAEFVKYLLKAMGNRKFMLILDEAHYIKNKKGTWHTKATMLSEKSAYSLILSGTPLPRRVEEAHYILNVIWPNIDHYPLNEEVFKKFDKVNNVTVKKDFMKIFSRMDKKKIVKSGRLEPLIKKEIEIEISDAEELLISKLELDSNNQLDQLALNEMNKALLIRRMQASSYPLLLEESLENSIKMMKEDILAEVEEINTVDDEEVSFSNLTITNSKSGQAIESLVEKIVKGSSMTALIKKYREQEKIPERWEKALELIESNNENIIVWDIFRKSMNDFTSFLKHKTTRSVFLINGSIKGYDREKIIECFKNSKNAILVASPATIAESVSLHKSCNIAIYLYKNYVGSHWMQSMDRIHRLVPPGEESNKKFIYDLVAQEKSIDKIIKKNLNDKESEQSILID